MNRPTAITVICVMGFVGAGLSLLALPLILSHVANFPSWYLPFLVGSSAAGLTMLIGMWKMKKWGALGYAGLAVVNQVALLLGGQWTALGLLIPAIVVGIALTNLSKMD